MAMEKDQDRTHSNDATAMNEQLRPHQDSPNLDKHCNQQCSPFYSPFPPRLFHYISSLTIRSETYLSSYEDGARFD